MCVCVCVEMVQLDASPLVPLGISISHKNTSSFTFRINQHKLYLPRWRYFGKKAPALMKFYLTLFTEVMSRYLRSHTCPFVIEV